jgi:hypothetical protein
MVKLTLAGRTDLEDFFESGVFSSGTSRHHPFLVFVVKKNDVSIVLANSVNQLLQFPDETKVMAQWQGQWSSDFFQFTIGDYKKYHSSKFDEWKNVRDVVKITGPRGKFHEFTFQRDDKPAPYAPECRCTIYNEAEGVIFETYLKRKGITFKTEIR